VPDTKDYKGKERGNTKGMNLTEDSIKLYPYKDVSLKNGVQYFAGLYVDGMEDDCLDGSKRLAEQVLENQEKAEIFDKYMDKQFMEEFGIDTVVCSKEVFEQNQRLRELVEEQIEFQRQIEPPNYSSTSLLHILQSLLDSAKGDRE